MQKVLSFLLQVIVVQLAFSKLYALEIDLTQDTVFFKQQVPVYQKWLEITGMAKALTVHDIRVKQNSVTLRIGLNYATEDSASAAWRRLKNDFEANNLFTLEQRLFYKMLHLMDIPTEYARIHVSDNYDASQIPCLDGKVYYKNGQVKSSIGACRLPQKDNVNIPVFELKENLLPRTFKFRGKDVSEAKNRSNIYRVIKRNAKKRFEKLGGKYTPRDMEEELVFRITNIKEGVIESNSLFHHECLDFLIRCSFSNENLFISIEVDGKFGEGFFKPKSADYATMDEKYSEELKIYVENFGELIRDWVTME